MPATPTYGFRYPAVTDPPNVPLDVQHLATDVEAKFVTNDAILNAAPIGLHVAAAANQSIGSGAGAVKLTSLTTNVVAANGITWNSGTSALTIVTAGVYSLYVSVSAAFASGNNFGAACHLSAAAPAAGTAWIAAPLFSSGQSDSFTATTKWFAAGTVLAPYIYNNGSAITLNPTTAKPVEFSVWKVA